MDTSELKDKIYSSFCSVFFAVDAKTTTISIIDNVAFLGVYGGCEYSCKLTSKGVKKDSWRKV